MDPNGAGTIVWRANAPSTTRRYSAMCCGVAAGAAYVASATSAPTSRNATTFTPRTGDVAPETSSEMIPYNSSARCGADGTSTLLSGVRPLHSLQQLESKHALP